MRATTPSVPEPHGIARRTIITGAAWSLPIIAVATAVPAAASSVARQTYSVTVTGAGAAQHSSSFTLPADATDVRYTVAGGNGAGSDGNRGGSGARLSGTFTDPQSAVLITLVAAGGGRRRTNNSADTGEGGQGFGTGGSAPTTSTQSSFTTVYAHGGGGGGASALYVGGVVAVVAGGGGGGGGLDGKSNDGMSPGGGLSVPYSPHGGDAGANGGTGQIRYSDGVEVRWVNATGGTGGVAAVGGLAGEGSTFDYVAPNPRTANGAPGGSVPSGRGGNGVAWSVEGDSSIPYEIVGTSGAGGGGYAGGGSGGTAVGLRPTGHVVGVSSGGGGGSSFTAVQAGGLILVPTESSLQPRPGLDQHGAAGEVTVTFEAAPGWTFP